MVQENSIKNMTGRKPDFKGDGIAVWKNTDKNGQEYLAVKVLGGKAIHVFPIKNYEKASFSTEFISANNLEVEE